MSEETVRTPPASAVGAASRPFSEQPPSPVLQSVPEWLATSLLRVQGQATIVAHHACRLNAIAIDQPALILPLAGTKRVELGAERGHVDPGAYLMVHQATNLQIENLPPAHGGEPYRAWAIGFPWRLVELARSLLSLHLQTGQTGQTEQAAADTRPTLAFTQGGIEPLLPALRQLLEVHAAGVPDAALVDHAMLGVLLALARNGHGHFLRASDPSMSARIRLLVSSAPDREWTSADFEQALHVSGATLRRKLAQENASLRALLLEARLHHGLALLQTSRKPLKSVALACGYRSVPSFTRNFIARFGVDPSIVAGR
jgi:AraC-like DNA-binding protein